MLLANKIFIYLALSLHFLLLVSCQNRSAEKEKPFPTAAVNSNYPDEISLLPHLSMSIDIFRMSSNEKPIDRISINELWRKEKDSLYFFEERSIYRGNLIDTAAQLWSWNKTGQIDSSSLEKLLQMGLSLFDYKELNLGNDLRKEYGCYDGKYVKVEVNFISRLAMYETTISGISDTSLVKKVLMIEGMLSNYVDTNFTIFSDR